jgi:uncharacterized membrane protein
VAKTEKQQEPAEDAASQPVTETSEQPGAGPLPKPMHRYGSIYVATVAGVIVTLFSVVLARDFAIEFGASAFFIGYVLMILFRLHHLTPKFLRLHADESDTPGSVILVVAIGTIVVASASLFVLLNSKAPDRLHMTLGIIAVVLGWVCVHTMLAFHYAYEYYGTDTTSPPGKDGHRPHVGGLDFPGSQQPDALSFLYFSFVVAMTAQVSDVTVTSNSMRRIVLFHGILSFFFNTVILAIAVNIVVSLGH